MEKLLTLENVNVSYVNKEKKYMQLEMCPFLLKKEIHWELWENPVRENLRSLWRF